MFTRSLVRTTIVQRLSIGFSSLLLITAIVAGLGIIELRQSAAQVRRIVEVNNAKTEIANSMLAEIDEMSVHARSVLLLTNLAEIAKEVAQVESAKAAYLKSEAELARLLRASDATASETRLADDIRRHGQETFPPMKSAVDLGEKGESVEATAMLADKVRPEEMVWRTKVSELVSLQTASNKALAATTLDEQTRALVTIMSLLATGLIVGATVGWWITTSISGPINRLIRVAEHIAEGDLTTELQGDAAGDFGRLQLAIASMQRRLSELVTQIRESADSIQIASSEVAAGNQDLSQRTELTAANLQRTASSIDELTVALKQSTSAASEANQLASCASDVAGRGGEAVAQVVSTMDAINASSKKIADIVGTIDGIAFQTNILALNAAVEAARAGEQGRGFAVVAAEVRALAQRSAAAAREIKQLIGSNVDRVAAGAKLVSSAGATMTDVVASVQRVTVVIAEVTTAAQEQQAGIETVNESVIMLDQMTQQNAALVEQSAASAESLRELSSRLALLVQSFHV